MEEKDVVRNRKNTGLRVTIVILILLLLVSVSFTVYDKILQDYIHPMKEVSREKNTKEELDIHSRVVRSLYNKVTVDQKSPSYYTFWKYNFIESGSNDQFNYDTSFDHVIGDFYVNKAKSSTRMLFIADKLGDPTYINCNPSIEKKNSYGKSGCYGYDGTYKGMTLFYEKSAVENAYKELYGDAFSLDTYAPIFMDLYRGRTFVYNDSLNGYVEYYIETGGTTGPGGYATSLDKAIKDGHFIHIYQDVVYTYYDESDSEAKNPLTREAKFKYTFELDKDGLYNFVSRIVEK